VCLNDLVVHQKTGGHVFGAFENGRMVAFCFGTPGYGDGKPYHYSRMLGVIPATRIRPGLLPEAEAARLRAGAGPRSVTWTFDPLQSRNAYFNIEKLGCVIRAYVVNLYPSRPALQRGLESDRFAPEWWIATRRVKDGSPDGGSNRPEILPGGDRDAPDGGGWREPEAVRTKRRDKRVSIEIPDDIDALKKDDLPLAQRWREATRDAFVSASRRATWSTDSPAFRRSAADGASISWRRDSRSDESRPPGDSCTSGFRSSAASRRASAGWPTTRS
jgi:predicted GNAT superfamily acetyltransferase